MLHKYVEQFHTLPPTNAGKHNVHPSLLNNEHISHAVRRYLTVLADGHVSNYSWISENLTQAGHF